MKSKHDIREQATKLFGEEETIIMTTNDPRYRYYQWLRGWFGKNKKEATNKCPFYQFMLWGTLILAVSYPFFIISLFFYYFLFKPICLISHFMKKTEGSFCKELEKIRYLNPVLFLGTVNSITIISAAILALLFLSEGIFWIGWVFFAITCIPAAVINGIWLGLQVLWICIVWISNFFVMSINWLFILKWLGLGFGVIFGVALFLWITYRLALILFASKWFKNFIKWICKIRDNKLAKRKKLIDKRKEEFKKDELRRILDDAKWREEHKEELAEQKRIANEKQMQFNESLEKILNKLSFIFKGIKIITKIIWWPFKKLYEIIYVLVYMFTETVGNHCPPIDFTYSIDIEGMVEAIRYKDSGGYIDLTIDTADIIIFFSSGQLPKSFKVILNSKVRINCVINTKDHKYSKRVYSVNSIINLNKEVKK